MKNIPFERSFASFDKEKVKQWHPTKNDDITPNQVRPNSHKKFWFLCQICNHSFDSRLGSITYGHWCTYCTGQKICFEEDCKPCHQKSFASFDEEKVDQWHSTMNGDVIPRQVTKHNKKKFWFLCKICNHSFATRLSDIIRGNWCPYCGGKKICFEDCDFCYQTSFASIDEEVVKQWHPTKNGDVIPRQLIKNTNKKFWFSCKVCNHSFDSLLSNIVNNHWCPYCSIPCQKICLEENCNFCYQKSFASFDKEKVSQWHPERNDDLIPRQIIKYSHKKCWFLCKICNHSFNSKLNDIIRGNWCPKCAERYSQVCIRWLKSLPNYENIQHAESEKGEYKLFPNTKHKADGYNPEINTVYEFHGCFWHGCPKHQLNRDKKISGNRTIDDLYKRTLQKEKLIKDAGYNLVVKWECD